MPPRRARSVGEVASWSAGFLPPPVNRLAGQAFVTHVPASGCLQASITGSRLVARARVSNAGTV